MNIDNIDDDIYYIESLNNKLYAHTKDEVYELDNSSDIIGKNLPPKFYFVNPDTIVNSEHILEFNYIDCYLLLENGVKIDKIVKKYNLC